jgi:predicted dehydrogenase
MKVAIGYIGAGAWGESKHIAAINYLRNELHEEVEIVALCEKDPERASGIALKHGIRRTYGSVEELSRDEDVNGFAVTITPSSLAEVLPVLARTQRPIFCEKPPGISYAEAQQFARILPPANVVGFNRRYFPIVGRFREIIATLPPPLYVNASFYRHNRTDSLEHERDPSRRRPSFVIGTALHMINLLDYAVGPIADVTSSPFAAGRPGVMGWDCRLKFQGGTPGSLRIIPCCGASTEWIEYHTDGASVGLLCSLYSPLDYPGKIVIQTKGAEQQVIAGDAGAPVLVNQGFVDEYREFFRLVKGEGERKSRSDFASSLNSMRIAEAIESW